MMIPEIYIDEWAHKAPWPSKDMIEQDLIISRALVDLYNNDLIRKNLVFRGGTALNKLFFHPPTRYSEDLDFVQTHPEPIGAVIDAIRSSLSWLGDPKRKTTERSAKLIYRFVSFNGIPAKLKVEINTTEHFNVLPLKEVDFSLKSEWYSNQATVKTYELPELMATKLRALYQRKKGRDLFDLWWCIENALLDIESMIDIFYQYGRYNNEMITRALFEESLQRKYQSIDFQKDMDLLVHQNIAWDFQKAFQAVKKQICPKLQGTAWKGNA